MSVEGPVHASPGMGGAEDIAKGVASTGGTKDQQEGSNAAPGVRYARPDVTDTRTTCLRLLGDAGGWEEPDLSFGFFSDSPDLAHPAQDLLTSPKALEVKAAAAAVAAARSSPPQEGSLPPEATHTWGEQPLYLVSGSTK